MRVQLRDCNPRGAWKHSRGRGRYPSQYFSSPRRFHDQARLSSEGGQLDDDNRCDVSSTAADHDPPSYTTNASAGGDEVPARESDLSRSPETNATGDRESAVNDEDQVEVEQVSSSSPAPLIGKPEGPLQTENYREWYDLPTSSSPTPPVSSLGSSASVAGPGSATTFPYPLATGGYYGPSPWIPPYAQQMPYQVPYFAGYPGYAMAGQQMPPAFASPVGSEAGGPAAGTRNPWSSPGMYGVRCN